MATVESITCSAERGTGAKEGTMFRTISTLATSVVASFMALAGAGAAFARPIGLPADAHHTVTQQAAYSPGPAWLAVAVVLAVVAAAGLAVAARSHVRPTYA